jgi:hypothetical protein
MRRAAGRGRPQRTRPHAWGPLRGPRPGGPRRAGSSGEARVPVAAASLGAQAVRPGAVRAGECSAWRTHRPRFRSSRTRLRRPSCKPQAQAGRLGRGVPTSRTGGARPPNSSSRFREVRGGGGGRRRDGGGSGVRREGHRPHDHPRRGRREHAPAGGTPARPDQVTRLTQYPERQAGLTWITRPDNSSAGAARVSAPGDSKAVLPTQVRTRTSCPAAGSGSPKRPSSSPVIHGAWSRTNCPGRLPGRPVLARLGSMRPRTAKVAAHSERTNLLGGRPTGQPLVTS